VCVSVPFFFARVANDDGHANSALQADVKEAGIILNVLYMPSSLSTFTHFDEQERFE
jgi:hypothetical protein